MLPTHSCVITAQSPVLRGHGLIEGKMPGVELNPGESLLLECRCLYRRGLIAHSGTVTLTNHRLVFDPKRLDRLAGARAWTVDLIDLRRVQRKGIDRVLELTTLGAVYRLMGAGTAALEPALRKALTLLESSAPEAVRMEPGERLVTHAAAHCQRAGQFDATGEVTVTNRRVCFSPSGRAKFTRTDVAFELPLEQLTQLLLEPAGRGVIATTAEDQIHLTGAGSERLFVAMAGQAGSPTPPTAGGFRTFPAVLHEGDAAHMGQLAILRDAIAFAPDAGNVEGPMVRLPLAQVVASAVLGVAAERLLVHTGEASWEFSLDAMDQRFRELVLLLRMEPSAREPAPDGSGRLTTDGLKRVLETFQSVLPLTEADVLIAGPGVIVRWPELARRGWILVTNGACWLVPAAGLLPGETLAPIPGSAFEGPTTDGGGLSFRSGADAIEFRPLVDGFGAIAREAIVRSLGASRVRNRRSSYRATPTSRFPVRVAVLASPDAPPARWVAARLGDLSADGCQIVTDAALGTAPALLLELQVNGGAVRLTCKPINTKPPEGFVTTWRYGVRFAQRTPAEDRLVRELWMKFQREETARRHHADR